MKENKCKVVIYECPTAANYDVIYPCGAFKDKNFFDCTFSEQDLNKCGFKACCNPNAQIDALENKLIEIEKTKYLYE